MLEYGNDGIMGTTGVLLHLPSFQYSHIPYFPEY
jgi:hypothetical protein